MNDDAARLFDEAEALRHANRHGEAVARYRQVLREAPDHPPTLIGLSVLHRANGNRGQAARYLRRAARLRPDDWKVRYELGYLLLRLSRFTEAEGHLRAAAESTLARAPLAARLASYARFMAEGREIARFDHRGRTVHFAVDGDNLGLDIFPVSGEFFERDELDHTRRILPQGAVIVDVGANAGNHLIYYGCFLAPRRIVPIEPHPGSVDLLLRNIALNGIDCVDARGLGRGAGRQRERRALAHSSTGDLVTAGLRASANGTVDVFPLDAMIDGKVDFIKIDVEAMELDVIHGARATIEASRPILMVEVQNANRTQFEAILDSLGYTITESFTGPGYENHFAQPGR
jgi:FkbM family methyltransferase